MIRLIWWMTSITCAAIDAWNQIFHPEPCGLILSASNHGRYDKGLVAVQSLAVFRLLEQRERYGSLREIINTAGPFDIPAFDECLPGVPLCGVPVVNHTCGLILKLRSLDGVVGVRSAAILAELEARGEPRWRTFGPSSRSLSRKIFPRKETRRIYLTMYHRYFRCYKWLGSAIACLFAGWICGGGVSCHQIVKTGFLLIQAPFCGCIPVYRERFPFGRTCGLRSFAPRSRWFDKGGYRKAAGPENIQLIESCQLDVV